MFAGKLTYVAPTIDPGSRRLAVRAEIKNADGALKPEMFANFRVASREGDRRSPSVPEAAVIYEGATARLWVAHAADKSLAKLTIVTIVLIIVLLLITYRSITIALIPLFGVLTMLAVARGIVSLLVEHGVIGISSFASNMLVSLVLGASTD